MNKSMQKIVEWSLRLFYCFYVSVSLCADFDAPQKIRLGKQIETLQVLACKEVVKQLSSLTYIDRFEQSPEEVERELCARVNNLPVQRMIAAKLLEPYKAKIAARSIVKGLLLCRGDLPIEVLQFNSDGGCLAVARTFGGISLWDTGTGEKLFQLNPFNFFNASVTALAFNPSGDCLAVGSNVGHKLIYDLVNRQLLHVLHPPNFRRYSNILCVNALAYCPEGKLLLSGDAAGALCVWDVQTGSYLRAMLHGPLNNPHAVYTINFLSNDRVMTEAETEFWLWDITKGKNRVQEDKPGYPRRRAERDDSKRGYWIYWIPDDSMQFCDYEGNKIHKIAQKGLRDSVKFSSDGSQIAVGTKKGLQIFYSPDYEDVLEGIDLMQALYVYKKLKEQPVKSSGWNALLAILRAKKPSPNAVSFFEKMQEGLPDSFKRVLLNDS